MKKIIFNIFGLAITTLILTGCGNDWLDLTPPDGVDSQVAITNYNDAQTARTGMYDGLQGGSGDDRRTYYAGRMTYYGDVRGDDMQARDQGMRTSVMYEMRYTTADNAQEIWFVPYNVNRRANNIIKALDAGNVTDATAEQIGKIRSEALVVRALTHFDLVRIYGNPYTMDNGASLGVPIVTEPLASDVMPSRNTVAEVYTQVLKDLNEAINSGYLAREKTQGYINYWAAKALLSRVYLFQGDNANALAAAEDVIQNSPYKLWTNEEYVGAWSKDNGAHANEMIFEIVNFSSDDWTDREGLAYLYHEDGYADAIVTKAFTDMMDENDIRLKVIMPSIYNADLKAIYGDARVFLNKYPADASGDMRLNNIPLFRLSEMYLTAAEAAVKTGDKTKAAGYLNTIAQRANPTISAYTEGNITLENVIIERRKELIGEGQRFFDAMRNNETVVRYTNDADQGYHYLLPTESMSFNRTYYRAILPIPALEVNVNPNLAAQQNPGY